MLWCSRLNSKYYYLRWQVVAPALLHSTAAPATLDISPCMAAHIIFIRFLTMPLISRSKHVARVCLALRVPSDFSSSLKHPACATDAYFLTF